MAGPIDKSEFDLVRQTPLFSGLPQDIFITLVGRAAVSKVGRGEVVFVQDDPVTNCYVVLEGWIKLYRLTPTGDEALVALFTRGQSFAEAAAFNEGRYPVSCEAVTEGRILCIPTGFLVRQIRENPEIGLSMLASTSVHLHELVQQIEQLKAHTGPQRVAEFLSSLCPVEQGACNIGLPYDKALIAARLGMAPESLSRAFARLRSLGVRVEHDTAAIVDVARLRRFANEERSVKEAL